MKPLLAHTYEPHRIPDGVPVWVQPKLNGVRALAGTDAKGRWRFQSRDELPWEYDVLKHLSVALGCLCYSKDTVLDGELYVHGWSLQKINGAVTPVRNGPNENTPMVQYHIFDVVDHKLPFIDRVCKVDSTLDGPVLFVPTYHVREFGMSAEQHYANFVSQGYEGMMYRIGDCPYTRPKDTHWREQRPPGRLRAWSDQDNRCWHLLKRKDWQDDEFECVGMEQGEGKQHGMVGAFVCKVTDYLLFTVGSGLTDSERIHYWNNPPIGRKIKVKYLTLSDAGIPLNPTILAVL